MKSGELEALGVVLPWLHEHNPWFSGYQSSLKDVHKAWDFVKQLQVEGRLMAAGPSSATTVGDQTLSEVNGDGIAVCMPVSDLSACTGTYKHLRAAADRVMKSELKVPLPEAWQNAFTCDIVDKHDRPLWCIPEPFWKLQSFTSVSFADRHFDAKVFVQQHPYGTGSLKSTCDAVSSRFDFCQSRLFSLDQKFTDSFDVESVASSAVEKLAVRHRMHFMLATGLSVIVFTYRGTNTVL